MQTYQFQAETKQLLDLMIHSIYSNKDIFLRELISNGSDALDKLRIETLKNPDGTFQVGEPHIRIETDEAQRTLTVSDNGIGMTEQEVVEYIGTIAKSGTKEFLKAWRETPSTDLPPELIGQFGVGLYASFMVADKVTLVTRRAYQEPAVRWESSGDGTYTLDETELDGCGTTITLHLKPADEDHGLVDYTQPWKIREIVKKYSDYVAYPIKMTMTRQEPERDEDGKPKPDGKTQTIVEDQTLNSMQAIWVRSPDQVSDDEYNEFYKHISHDWTPPLHRVFFKSEGTQEFRVLLFLPEHAPFDMFTPEDEGGIHLYIKRVFIMNDCKELIPQYLRFVRGVVDSEDLPLNISREILQKDQHIRIIRKRITSKVIETLRELQTNDREKYLTFWKAFGKVLKEGLYQDREHQPELLELLLAGSTHSPDQLTTLSEYIERMPEEQEKIYYMTGKSRSAIENSPHLEVFKEKGYEVLLLTEPIDELWVQTVGLFKERAFQSAGKGTVKINPEAAEQAQEQHAQTFGDLMEFIKNELDEHVKEVRISQRLTSSPACLVGESSDMSPQMEELLRAMNQDAPRTKRILEINPAHPVLEKLQTRFEADRHDPALKGSARLLYGQALLAEGSQLPDPGAFSREIAQLMTRAL